MQPPGARGAVRMLYESERKMSNTKKATINDVPGAVPQPEGIVTPWQEAVAEFQTTVLAAAAKLPGYADGQVPDAGRLPRRVASAAFIGAVVATVERHEQLQALNEFNVVECRTTLQYSEAVQPALATLYGVARQLEVLMRAREALAGRSALRMYRLTRGLASNPKNSHLVPAVESMRAVMKRRLARRSAPAAPPSIPTEQGGAKAA